MKVIYNKQHKGKLAHPNWLHIRHSKNLLIIVIKTFLRPVRAIKPKEVLTAIEKVTSAMCSSLIANTTPATKTSVINRKAAGMLDDQ